MAQGASIWSTLPFSWPGPIVACAFLLRPCQGPGEKGDTSLIPETTSKLLLVSTEYVFYMCMELGHGLNALNQLVNENHEINGCVLRSPCSSGLGKVTMIAGSTVSFPFRGRGGVFVLCPIYFPPSPPVQLPWVLLQLPVQPLMTTINLL